MIAIIPPSMTRQKYIHFTLQYSNWMQKSAWSFRVKNCFLEVSAISKTSITSSIKIIRDMSFMMGEVQYKIYTVRLHYFSLKTLFLTTIRVTLIKLTLLENIPLLAVRIWTSLSRLFLAPFHEMFLETKSGQNFRLFSTFRKLTHF